VSQPMTGFGVLWVKNRARAAYPVLAGYWAHPGETSYRAQAADSRTEPDACTAITNATGYGPDRTPFCSPWMQCQPKLVRVASYRPI